MIATIKDRWGTITTIAGEISRVQMLVDRATANGGIVVKVTNERNNENTPRRGSRVSCGEELN